MVIEIALSSRENNDIDFCWHRKLSHLGFADGVALLSENQSLNDCFVSSNCGMVLQDLTSSKPNLALVDRQLCEMDRLLFGLYFIWWPYVGMSVFTHTEGRNVIH